MQPSTARSTEVGINPARGGSGKAALGPPARTSCAAAPIAPLFALLIAILAWPVEGTLAAIAGAGAPVPAAPSTEAQAPSRPVAAASGTRHPKRRMRIGFYINAVREVDWSAENFLADFYWWIRYPAPASDDDRKLAEALEFVNGNLGVAAEARAEVLEHEIQERKTISGPDGAEMYVAFRSVGRFYFAPNFARYPFDRQSLPIVIEHEVLTAEELELVDDEESYRRAGGPEERWGLAPTVRVTDLEIQRATRIFKTEEYRTNFGDPMIQDAATSFARVIFTIEAARDYRSYLIKILIPLFIIVVLAYLVFFVPARELEVAVGLTVTSILACIAFQLTVADDLPDIGYIVTSDLIFYLCYFLIMTAMAETVYTHSLEKRGRESTAARIEHWARFLYPSLLFLVIFVIVASGLAAR
jgi:hypothetical protein